MGGIGTLYDASSGKEVWQQRLGGNFSATPLVANGLFYAIDESGLTTIIQPGAKPVTVAQNSLGDVGDEIFRAVPTPSRGQLLIRSDKALYCVGNSSAE
jgi:outer membrane protein assembly factor BamB